MIEVRIRSQIGEEELEAKVGKQLLNDDYNLLLTGPARVLKPDGSVLCIYLPNSVPESLRPTSYEILHGFKGSYTDNRGLASGAKRYPAAGKPDDGTTRTRSLQVDSAIAGSFEAQGVKQYCRLTAWTGKETEQWRQLWPLLEWIAEQMASHVPERYANQMRETSRTAPEWVIPGTPFTTITINNTYSTGVHKDKGDLDTGFSTLLVFRRGQFKGGCLTFPEYRVAVDMQDSDLLLMDAHAWHGNTEFDPKPTRNISGQLQGDPGFERISLVAYFRTKMTDCGSAADEAERARIYGENRNAIRVGE